MTGAALSLFLVGAGLIALWIDSRFPGLAPGAMSRRAVAAALGFVALVASPVLDGSVAEVYVTLFAILLPALVASLLGAIWMMRGLRDLQPGH